MPGQLLLERSVTMAEQIEIFGEDAIVNIEKQLRARYPNGEIDDSELANFSNILCDAWPTVKTVLEVIGKLLPEAKGLVSAVIAVGEGAYRVFCK
jgi:uncharacterized protein with HEPN domain